VVDVITAARGRRAAPDQPAGPPKVALVLQGGGALGAYHIGAFEALHAAGFGPDWVAGISIGAFNAAIIAGNDPEDRLEQLSGFWHAISWPELPGLPPFRPLQILHDQLSSAEALAFGQPNFFSPRPINPYLLTDATPGELSFYDTAALHETLPRFASFDRINRKTTRLTLGTTNIASGVLEFFDSHTQPIEVAHVIASGALPPGFPATEIAGKFYWDGGCVSNTPLEALAAAQGEEALLVFVIDLWDAAGVLPNTMNEVFWRAKQIQYAGRAAHDLKIVESVANHLHAQAIARNAALPEMAGLPETLELRKGRLDLVHITYHPGLDHIASSDTEFSRSSIAARRKSGRLDMERALATAPWAHPMPAHHRARIHHVAGAASH
jgi:NTE family protein